MCAGKAVEIANTSRMVLCSALNQRLYSISVGLPLVSYPEAGCPVLYVLDGDWYFGSAVEAVRVNAPEVAVVGIGYPDDETHIRRVLERRKPLPVWAKGEPAARVAVAFQRTYDLTLPTSDEVLSRDSYRPWELRASDVGGLDTFLRVLETEIKPRITAMVPIDPSNQVIFGHSFGGLAVTHALFVEPGAFRTFVAASPAIWWNDRAVLQGECKFADAVRTGAAGPRVLITMGGDEDTADAKSAAKLELDFEEFAGHLRQTRMLENARELTQRLRALRGSGSFEVAEYAVFANQDHGISVWPALGRTISFAFPP